jgi:hypothetical protein
MCAVGSLDCTGSQPVECDSTGGWLDNGAPCAQPTPDCDQGLCSCTGSMCGSCVDEQTDPSNCGACLHSCQGGTCSAGVCQPVVLASGRNDTWGIAVDSTNVYWTEWNGSGNVMMVPTGGGTPTTLESGLNYPFFLAAHDPYVYWTENQTPGGVFRASTAGGMITTIATTFSPQGIATDGTNVYWAGRDGNVWELPVAGSGTSLMLGSGQANPWGVTVDSTNAYWTNNVGSGNLAMAPISDTGPVTTLASGQQNMGSIAVDATSVYWTNAGTQANNFKDGTVMKVTIGGGVLVTIASSQDSPEGIAVDASNVYWGSQAGVLSAPVGGGPDIPLAFGTPPINLAEDSTSLYWTAGSTVMKVAKP